MEAIVVIVIIVWVLNMATKARQKPTAKPMASSGMNEVNANEAAHQAGYRDQGERKAALKQKYGSKQPMSAQGQQGGLHREKLKTAMELEREQPSISLDLNTTYRTEQPDLQMRPPMMQDCIHQSIAEETHEGIDPCHTDVRPLRKNDEEAEEEPLYAFTGADMARAVVMAEVLGKPGGWKARNLH